MLVIQKIILFLRLKWQDWHCKRQHLVSQEATNDAARSSFWQYDMHYLTRLPTANQSVFWHFSLSEQQKTQIKETGKAKLSGGS